MAPMTEFLANYDTYNFNASNGSNGDTIIPSGPPLSEITPREAHVREAATLLIVFGSLVAAALCVLSTRKWWSYHKIWSFHGIAALWFVAIAAFNAVIYTKGGEADRTTFVIASLYGDAQMLLACLLANITASRSLALVWLWGFIHSALILFLQDIKTVFTTTSALVITNSLLLTILFFYGKQAGFGIAAFAHLLSTVNIFTGIVKNFGVVPYYAVQFFSIGFQIFLVVGGVLNASANDDELQEDQAFRHPLQNVNIATDKLMKLLIISFPVGVVISLLLVHGAAA